MSHEAEMPGWKANQEQLQMICCRYHTASRFVEGKRVLEVGCGGGLGLGYLAKRARRVIGTDYAQDNLKCVQQHYQGRIDLVNLDAHRLPFKDDCFDVALCFEMIFYLARPDQFLDECHRILKKGGTFLLCLPNKDRPGFHKSPLSVRYFSVPELSALLNHHRFDAKLFGAFPILRKQFQQELWSAMIRIGVAVLKLIPKGREIREFLNQVIFGKTLLLKNELVEEDMVAENFQLTPLPGNCSDHQYQILYAIAHAR
ncbi:class I SAM-dependent methyltransferase [Chloroflexota bacterium]